jgi:hypothetical protein
MPAFAQSSTSMEAYSGLRSSGHLTRSQDVVLAGLKRFGPCTATELTDALLKEHGGAPDPSFQKRLSELVTRGQAERLQPRRCRITGRMAITWSVKGPPLLPPDRPSPEKSSGGPLRSPVVASQRYTTSLREIIQSTVRTRLSRPETCGKCGGIWYGGRTHSPHFNDARVLVDCVGAEVRDE